MLYQCKLCNINTNKITNFTNHCKTLKHIDKEKNNVFCFVCDKDYKSRRQYTKHRYNKHKNDVIENVDNINSTVVLIIDDKKDNKNYDILDDKINDNKINNNKNNKIIKNKKKDNSSTVDVVKEVIKAELEHSNSVLKEELKQSRDEMRESNKHVVRVVNNAITKASSLIKYLMEHHQSTPPMKRINTQECVDILRIDYKCPEDKKNKYSLEKKLIYHFKYNIFVQNISKSILKLVNHKDPQNQQIWNTDITRQNYVVKISQTKWNADIAGIRFTNFIIKPLLDSIHNLINSYRINSVEKENVQDKSHNEFLCHIEYIKLILSFECALENESFIKPILKFITPYIRYIDVDFDEFNKLNELEQIQENLMAIVSDTVNNNEKNDDFSDEEDVVDFNDVFNEDKIATNLEKSCDVDISDISDIPESEYEFYKKNKSKHSEDSEISEDSEDSKNSDSEDSNNSYNNKKKLKTKIIKKSKK